MEKLFEEASRKQLRYKSGKGTLMVEDLWTLPLEDLDTVAKGLKKELAESEDESFIKKRTTANKTIELKFELVKHIISVRMAEADEKKLAVEKAAKKEMIKNLIAEKAVEGLKAKSIEELQAELAGI